MADFDKWTRAIVEYTATGGENETLRFAQFGPVAYVKNPIHEIQQLSIFVNERQIAGGTVNGYILSNAPIFMPNEIGGYMPGLQSQPETQPNGKLNTIGQALLRGYVVVSAGARGRGMTDRSGRHIGNAPAHIVDTKAAVRWLRANAADVPGDLDRIITSGTSAGGATSALQGCTGNHPDYEPLLDEIGAYKEPDAVFASMCYCPIIDLDHADMAYEWEFDGVYEAFGQPFPPRAPKFSFETMRAMIEEWNNEDNKPKPVKMPLTDEEIAYSKELAPLFPAYLESLELKDSDGRILAVDPENPYKGTFCEALEARVLESAQKQLDQGIDVMAEDGVPTWLDVEDGRAIRCDLRAFFAWRTRLKPAPAFDKPSCNGSEGELFGDADIEAKHFSRYMAQKEGDAFPVADERVIRMENPLAYIDDPMACKARHFRIRHGLIDRDTSIAVSEIFHAKLENAGIDTELAHPWGIPHAGDYDLNELFDWIDAIV